MQLKQQFNKVAQYLKNDGYSKAREYKTTFDLIRFWAKERNLIKGATVHAQMVKLMEETGELANGIAKNKPDVIKDSIGDVVVVLTILAEQSGLTIEECIASAYNEIKNRKGKMVNGVFIKDEK